MFLVDLLYESDCEYEKLLLLAHGGVTPESIPSPEQVAEFIWDCARAPVPFKATAGLHHAVRAEQPYETSATRAPSW